MNITHFEVSDEDKKILHSLSSNVGGLQQDKIDYIEENLSSSTISRATKAEAVTVFVNSMVDKSIIDSLPNLKLIITRSTGFDHIDVAHAQSKGILVCNIPAYGSRTVAEFTFALILTLSRKVFSAIEQIKFNKSWDVSNFEGFNLQGKTLGVVGTGRIGLNVIQIAKGFDMKIMAHDAFPNEDKAKAYGFEYSKSLEELLAASDIVTLHVPANPDTHHLINLDNISKVKKGCMLINTARGDVIDPAALIKGLNEGILGGAGLDVLEGEHELKEEAELMSSNHLSFEKLKVLLEDHELMDHPKVIITPHVAFNTREARTEIMTTTLTNLSGFMANEPQNVITI